MESNLNEFVGMVCIVGSATFFILMFRWGIYRFGRMESELQQTENAGVTQR
tara:strand:+ start:95 stop:247 length:153 start_codon:yes stop_codon:yes gene_type:complete